MSDETGLSDLREAEAEAVGTAFPASVATAIHGHRGMWLLRSVEPDRYRGIRMEQRTDLLSHRFEHGSGLCPAGDGVATRRNAASLRDPAQLFRTRRFPQRSRRVREPRNL